MTSDTVGGVWTYSLDLARQFDAAGVSVALATMGRPLSSAQVRDAGAIENMVVYESNYKLEWMDDPWDDVFEAGKWLLGLEDVFRPDVVHLNGYCHGQLPWAAPVVAVCHSCVLSWWEAVYGVPAPPEWQVYQSEVRKGLQSVDIVVAPTQAMLSDAARFYGPFASTRVIPNGRSLRHAIAGDKAPFVLSVGRVWDDAKNIAKVDEIAADLPWLSYVAGEVGSRQIKNIYPLGLLDQKELGQWYSRASIFIAPARYEPFGLSILEAAQAGCALILGDIPSLRENWAAAALFVNPESADELKQATMKLINDPSLLASLGAAARSRSQQFGIDRCGASYLNLYGDAIEFGRRPSRSVQGISLA